MLARLPCPNLSLPAAGSLVGQEHDVRGPLVKAVKDVSGVDDGGSTLVCLLLQPKQEVLSHANVEASGNLIKKEDLERPAVGEALERDETARLRHNIVHLINPRRS